MQLERKGALNRRFQEVATAPGTLAIINTARTSRDIELRLAGKRERRTLPARSGARLALLTGLLPAEARQCSGRRDVIWRVEGERS